MASKKTEVATRKTAELMDPSMFEHDAGKGMENADKDSYAIPFLVVLQGLSPQLDTVKGAKPGLICNTITEEIYDEVRVIPCAFQRKYLRWTPREAGGGYKGSYKPFDVDSGEVAYDVNDDGTLVMENGDHLKDTREHYVLVEGSNGSWYPAVLSLTSTQIKKSKRWMSLIGGIEMEGANGTFTPPSFSHMYTLTTEKEENAKGSWWSVKISKPEAITDLDLYHRAGKFNAQVNEGEVKTQEPEEEAATGF